MFSLSLGSRTSVGFFSFVLGIILSTGLQYAFAAWNGPTQAPPNGNTDTPLNVSAVNQTKAGSLTLGVSVLSPVFVDSDNTGYRVDPNGTSVVNELYSYGAIYSQARNYSKTDDWALTTYTAAGGTNAQPGNPRSSIYTNDVYIRSGKNGAGAWVSDLTSGSSGGGSLGYADSSSNSASTVTFNSDGSPVTVWATASAYGGQIWGFGLYARCDNGSDVYLGGTWQSYSGGPPQGRETVTGFAQFSLNAGSHSCYVYFANTNNIIAYETLRVTVTK